MPLRFRGIPVIIKPRPGEAPPAGGATFNQALTADAVVVTASMQRQANKNVTASSVAVTGALTKRANKNVTASSVAVTGALTKRANKNVTATAVVATGTLQKQVNKILLAGGDGGIDSFTKLMLHCDGADTSTTFTDSSSAPHTVTANGNVQVDTAQSQFGGASALFDGTGDYLSLDGSSDFAFPGDFSVDFWIKIAALAAPAHVYDARDTGIIGANLVIYVDSATGFVHVANGTTDFAGTTNLNTAAWFHVAVTRSGSTTRLFVNGTQEGSNGSDSVSYLNPAGRPWFGGKSYGGDSGLQSVNGWLDEIRVSKGVARWTSNFTPPAAPYSASGVVITASLVALKVIVKSLTATAVVVTGSLQKQVNKNMTATTVAVSASLQKLVKKNVTATAVVVTGTLQALKVILKALTATPVVVTATLSKRVNKNMTATAVAATASITKTITKALTAAPVAVSASITKTITKTLSAVASAISATINAVFQAGAGAVPAIQVLPAVAGNPNVGGILTSTTGTWTNSPISYTYQWQRDWGAGVFVSVPGATSATYTLTQADVNTKLRTQVTAHNATGDSLVASSNSIGPVGITYNKVVMG